MVFIIADDVSWNDFGCYGNEDVNTPHIDRLAESGMRFTNVYLTASSCSPSRTSIISGRYPHNTGAPELHMPLPGHLDIFPEQLQQAGYYTGASGKWHMGEPAKRGFDTLVISGDLVGPGGEDQWVNLLRERPKDRPFFFWFAAFDAHRGWSADTCENPHKPGELSVPAGLADRPATRQDLASYYNEIQRFDRYVGAVYETLMSQGVADNTLIIVMADNGRPFPRAKTRVYDSGMKTPFVVWWPRGIARPGAVCDAMVSMVDLAPTLVEMAGEEPSGSYQGRSFQQLFREPGRDFRTYVFSEHNWHDYEAYERMVRTGSSLYLINRRPQFPNAGPADAVTSPSMQDLKRLRDSGLLNPEQKDVFLVPRPEEELYDCRIDPGQVTNVVEDPRYSKQRQELRAILSRWQRETGDTEPDSLTPSWYLRDTTAYVKTPMHGIRGETPGAANNADEVLEGGPF